jgi:hypothetical protein
MLSPSCQDKFTRERGQSGLETCAWLHPLLHGHTPQRLLAKMNLAIRNLIRLLLRLLTGAHFDGNHTISLSVALLGAIIDRQHQLVEEWSVWCSMAFVPCACPPHDSEADRAFVPRAPHPWARACPAVDGEAMRGSRFKIATSLMCHGVATDRVETSCRIALSFLPCVKHAFLFPCY